MGRTFQPLSRTLRNLPQHDPRLRQHRLHGLLLQIRRIGCPVTFFPVPPNQIGATHHLYVNWREALSWVRDELVAGDMLLEIEVTAAMPKVRSSA